jgi:DNA-directed RNA polymerase subunit RPC12/RpoP
MDIGLIVIIVVYLSVFTGMFIWDVNPICTMCHRKYHKEEVSFGKGRHIHCKKCGHNTLLG